VIVTYTPADGEAREWEFDARRVPASQAERVERRYGGSFAKWSAEVQQGSARARRLLLWHLLCRDHPTLRWEDTPDYLFGELEITYSSVELQELITQAEKSPMADTETKDAVIAGMRGELATALAREAERDGRTVPGEVVATDEPTDEPVEGGDPDAAPAAGGRRGKAATKATEAT
jgi:hypothetical protein